MRYASLPAAVVLAMAAVHACASAPSLPTHTASNDCRGAERPRLPDGKSILTCAQDGQGFHWTVSQAPADLAACEGAPMLLLGCVHGERGATCTRTPADDGGFTHSDWSPVCR
jgi:hypothetical protein